VFDEISRPKDNATSLEKSVLNDTYISVLNWKDNMFAFSEALYLS
jgi:hypothetical protein